MSTLNASRAADSGSTRLTMAAVIDMISADVDLSERKRQEIRSAFNTLSKAFQCPLADLEANPRSLNARLQNFTPAMAGLSKPRWHNAISLMRFALQHLNVIDLPARSTTPFAPEWAALFQPLTRMGDRLALAKFARFCSDAGIQPDDVTDATFDAFLKALTERAVVKLPHKVHRKAVVTWNRLVSTTRNWPSQLVAVPSYSRVFVLPWKQFPATLKADVDAYLDRLAGSDLLGEDGFKPLAPRSLKTRRHQLHAYLSSLVLEGHDAATLISLAVVVQPETVRKGLNFFIKRSTAKNYKQAHDIARMLVSLARHFVQADPETLVSLSNFGKRLRSTEFGMSPKNVDRMRQFDDADNVRALLLLPRQILAEVAKETVPTRSLALKVQSALAIELLLMVPMRRTNLAKLNIAEHIVRSRRNVVRLSIPGTEVKNGVPIDTILTAETAELLDLYLTRYRPSLTEVPSPWLFPGLPNRPKSCERLAGQISDCVKDRLGLLVNPHLFRHIAAKLCLDRHPGQYGLVRLMHGHRSVDTTTRFYCSMETKPAHDLYDRLIANIRDQEAPKPPPRQER